MQSSDLTQKYTFDNKKYNFYDGLYSFFNEKYNLNEPLTSMHLILNSFSLQEKMDFLQIPEIGKTDRKSVFINDYHNYVDTNPEFTILYKSFITDNIKPLFPDEEQILYQKTPNLRISFPFTTAIGRRPDTDPDPFIIGLHNDAEFSHPPEEMNFIIPVTRMFSSNSIFYEETPFSTTDYDKYTCLQLFENEFFRCYFNKLRHYNIINGTGQTRVSLDFRIIPFSKYNENYNESTVTSNTKLKLGEYFYLI